MVTLLQLLLLTQAGPPAQVELSADDPPILVDASLVLRYTATRAEPQTWFSVTAAGALDTEALLLPRPLHHFGSVVAFFGLETELTRGLSLRTLIDSGELRTGQSLEPPLDQTITSDGQPLGSGLFNLERVKELAFQVSWKHGAVEVGRRLAVVGESLVFEDFATGAAMTFDLGAIGLDDWTVDAGGYVVGYDLDSFRQPNGLVHLRVGRDLSLFESVGIFGAVLIENGLLQDTLVSALSEGIVVAQGPLEEQVSLSNLFLTERTSSGYLGYAGIDAQLLPAEGWSVRGVAAGAFGRVDVHEPGIAFLLSSWAATAEVSYGITSDVGVGTFLVAMSGDQPPLPRGQNEVDYHGFIAVAPYWTWTGLFFSGGLTQGLYPGQAAAAGVNGHGVMVGGARAELSTDYVWTELRVAGLWALAAPPPLLGGSGYHYGVEADLLVEWQPLDWLGVGVELDVLRPGSYFQQHDVAFRAIGQVHARAGN